MGNSLRTLNVCLHNVSENIDSIYTLQFMQIINLLQTLTKLKNEGMFDVCHIYFDDGYSSLSEIIQTRMSTFDGFIIHAAIITGRIGQQGYLDIDEIKKLHDIGVIIDSHGVSHSALAVFQGKTLLDTLPGGEYRDMPYGKENTLTIEEVKYQLAESKQLLEDIIKNKVSNFVLPFGLYNKETIAIATHSTNYEKIYTCHEAYDIGQYLAPRLLITQENINNVEIIIRDLTDTYTPLFVSSMSRAPKSPK